jgi:hypothetical protein
MKRHEEMEEMVQKATAEWYSAALSRAAQDLAKERAALLERDAEVQRLQGLLNTVLEERDAALKKLEDLQVLYDKAQVNGIYIPWEPWRYPFPCEEEE